MVFYSTLKKVSLNSGAYFLSRQALDLKIGENYPLSPNCSDKLIALDLTGFFATEISRCVLKKHHYD